MITDQTSSPGRIGRLTRSITLPTHFADYSPDGLSAETIDALIAECGLDLTAVDEVVEESFRDANPAPRLVGTTWNEAQRRHRRRAVRRITRSMDTTLANTIVVVDPVRVGTPGEAA